MRVVLRLTAVLISALATFYFVFWVGGALVFGAQPTLWGHWVLALVAAGFAAYLAWVFTSAGRRGLFTAVVGGAVITGSIAFVLGFFGPMIFTPGANQGPMLGLFFTGPLGFVLGAAGGAVVWMVRRRSVSGTSRDAA